MVYCFERGRIEVDGWGGAWIRVYAPTLLEQVELPGAAQSCDDNFVDAILGRAEPQTSPVNGVLQSELMDAIYESAKTGQVARPKVR
jgi:predicted dehydrogenase